MAKRNMLDCTYVKIAQENYDYVRRNRNAKDYIRKCKFERIIDSTCKIIAIIVICVLITLIAILIKSYVQSQGKMTSYYGESTNNPGYHYTWITERKENCEYVGSDTFITDDGNKWVYSDEIIRIIGNRYSIDISDNGTTDNIYDDIIISVSK